ncbi:MAG: polymer-forming cytoskeletal protein [Wenzhouxiangella sp.]|nr:MAG: polymer-forming cytoskeletal protein [Wenzhouxiangella sp.]
MFNKRENGPAETENSSPASSARPVSDPPPSSSSKSGSAVIGASIQIDGSLKGDEDLLIQGKVKGTVELKKNSVTIGESGQVNADIYAQTIAVEGRLEGSLVASERVVIRKTAHIKGTIVAPRVMLEDGARFNGSIDMDPETDALKSAFSASARDSSAKADKPAEPARSKPAEPKGSGEQTAKGLL